MDRTCQQILGYNSMTFDDQQRLCLFYTNATPNVATEVSGVHIPIAFVLLIFVCAYFYSGFALLLLPGMKYCIVVTMNKKTFDSSIDKPYAGIICVIEKD